MTATTFGQRAEAALDQIDARLLFRRLLGDLGPAWLASVADLLGGPRGRHVVLARAVMAAEGYDLGNAVHAALPAPIVADDVISVTFWLQRVAPTAIRLGIAAPPAPDMGRHPAGLVVDDHPGLRSLPLLPFAADVAPRQPAGRLLVVAATLTGCCGAYSREDAGGLIRLDLHQLDTDASRDRSWRHELGHAVDPDPPGGLPHAQESWADAVGELLLERRPARYADIADDLDALHRRLRPADVPDEASDPADVIAALVKFLALNLGDPIVEGGG